MGWSTEFQHSTARVEIVDGRATSSTATGFLVSENLVLTALHAVAVREGSPPVFGDPPRFRPGTIWLTFPRHRTRGTLCDGQWDGRGDWVLLQCDDPPNVPFVPLADLDEAAADWRTFGYPEANVRDGMFQHGTVVSCDAPLDGTRALQLYGKEAASFAKERGASGSPVMVEDVAVGHLRYSLLSEGRAEAGTLYACRAGDVYAKCKKVAFKKSPFSRRIGPRAALTDLLPFLVNRERQIGALTDLLGSAPHGRPLVCVVHGAQSQSADMFIRQLTEVELARILGFSAARSSAASFHLAWPELHGPRDESLKARVRRRLGQELGRKVLNEALADPARIAARLAQHPGPSVLYSHVSSSICGPSSLEAIRAVAEFWGDWPDTPDPLLVVISITYARSKGLLEALGLRASAKRLRRDLENLDWPDLNVRFKVLPELESVEQRHAENWARDILKASGGSLKPVLRAIDNLYSGWSARTGRETIPMDELAEQLARILERHDALSGEFA